MNGSMFVDATIVGLVVLNFSNFIILFSDSKKFAFGLHHFDYWRDVITLAQKMVT